MWELVKAGGWLMLPLVLCSIFTVAISIERFIRLKKSIILPEAILLKVGQSTDTIVQQLKQSATLKNSPLGRIFISGYQSKNQYKQQAINHWR